MVMPVPVPVTDPVSQLKLPPGFRFHPTDEELMLQYLNRKVAGNEFPLQIIGDVNLYNFDPWELPSKAMFGEKEWYFFSPRDRKYPNGSRPNRVAGSGFWKATGTDKVIVSEGRKVGIKKALVFYVGKAPRGSKTNWIMHEYRLSDHTKKNHSIRLDDWVLCRIYKKNSSSENTISGGRSTDMSQGSPSSSSSQFDGVLDSLPAIDDRFNEEDDKMGIRKLDSGNYDWANVGAFGLQHTMDNNNQPNSSSMDPTFHMQMKFEEDEVQNGIRNERMENSGCLFSQSFLSTADPFAIRYPTYPNDSGYRR